METVIERFRKHPDREPTGKLTIIGGARCSAVRMDAYLGRRSPQAPKVAELYLRSGNRYGIRGDVAFCLMIQETRAWTRSQSGPAWLPMTLGQWGDEETVGRLMRVLRAFASDEPIDGEAQEPLQRMLEKNGWLGTAACWEDLNGKWTERGDRFGQDVASIWRNMMEWRGEGEVFMVADEERERERELALRLGAKQAGPRAADWTAIGTPEMRWLGERGALPDPAPHPDRKVTWAELAALLARMERPEPGE